MAHRQDVEGVPVFTPDRAAVRASALTAFMRFCETETGREFDGDTAGFHEFSVSEFRRFWRLLLRWSELTWEGSADPVCTEDACERAVFFPDVRLNYVENLLGRDRDEDRDRPALVARHASRPTERLSRGELLDRVTQGAAALRRLGVGAGDRVVAVVGNNAEAVVGGLATAAIGATFSSAAPDMGAPAILSRFGQLAPVVMLANLAADGLGAPGDLAERVASVARDLPSLKAVVALDEGPLPQSTSTPFMRLSELVEQGDEADAAPGWERFAFNHPLFVLFSSGTTGPPKCLVHGAGGTLLEHVKEHRLHTDLGPGDRLFFHTSAAWMMWNWQLSALASGAELVLYDGPVTGPETLWRLVAEERVTVFGTSPPYLQLCEQSGYSPRRELALSELRAVLSTGSILHDRQYDWVADHVGAIPVQSISGGTDIIGCFVLGNPNLPVHRGEAQCRSLGLDVRAQMTGTEPTDSSIGELVCANPFPSRPLGLLGDEDGRRFHAAYFRQNPGVWTHGDLIEISPEGRARLHGRSDGILNVRGVRVGPAEIYRVLRDIPEIAEAMAVEQTTPETLGQSRMVLLVVMREPGSLDGRLTVRIRRELARRASPAHVPELVVEVDELPSTHSGKRSERAATDALNGVDSANLDALSNPHSLDQLRLAVEAVEVRMEARAASTETTGGRSTEERLRAIWEQVLGISPLRPDDNFFDVGGTSLTTVQLFQAIHEQMGLDPPLSIMFEAQTTAAMAEVLDRLGDEHVPQMMLLSEGAAGRPLFVIHSLAGDVLELRPLTLRLSTERPVWGVLARGLDPREAPHATVEEMADDYIEKIREVQPTGPYALAGYSFGGLVAYEMARRLSETGEELDFVGLVDAYVDHRCLPAPSRWIFPLIRLRRSRLPSFLRDTAHRFAPNLRLPGQRTLTEPLPPVHRRLEEICGAAFEAYRPSPSPVAAVFFRSEEREADLCDPLPVWSRLASGGLTIEQLPGGHHAILAEPGVEVLAERLARHLDDARVVGRP